MEISHEEFITILKEKDKYEKMKENMRNVNEKQNKIIFLTKDWAARIFMTWLINKSGENMVLRK